jgi:hypothetical protein
LQLPQSDELYGTTVTYIVYKTIADNPNITINQLVHLLQQEFLFSLAVVKATLGSLLSKTIYGAVTRFQPRGKSIEVSHLHVKEVASPTFNTWLKDVEENHPELLDFVPPQYKNKG